MRLRLALPLAGGVWLAAAAAGGARTLTAADAVRETLARDPQVAQALAQVAERRGQNLELTGAFDGVAFVDSTVDYTRQALAGEVLKDERKRRIQLDLVDRFFTNTALDLESILRGENALNDTNSLFFGQTDQRQGGNCGVSQTEVRIDLGVDIEGEQQGEVFLCLDTVNDFGSVRAIGTTLQCSDECKADPECANQCEVSVDSLRTLLFFANLEGLNTPLETLAHESRSLLEDQARIALRLVRLVAEGARYARARLGGLPDEHELIDFSTQLGYRRRLRSGIGITPALELRATEENFAGKLRIVAFGDATNSNLFTATARVSVDLPLGKNRGLAAVRAPELASAENLRAARALAVQTASDQALETLRAYWELAAAGERVAALERSLKVKTEIDEAVGALIDGQELPAVERARSSAQVAQVRSQLAGARQQLVTARAELARAIGLEGEPATVEGLQAEALAGYATLAAPVDPAAASALVETAISRRADVFANERFVEANRILEKAARLNLKPEVTLAVNFSYSGLEESFEERYYDLEGFWKAASGKLAGPSYGVALRFTVPVGNHEARGRLVQAESKTTTADIQYVDLKRTIANRVHELTAAVDRARREVDARREALDHQQQLIDSSLEQLKFGDISVIDTLTTEDQLNEATLAWIEATRAWLELESRLRFETNTLLVDGGFDADPRSLALRPFDQPVL